MNAKAPAILTRAVVAALLGLGGATGERERTIKVGSTREVRFRTEVNVGGSVLAPGTYRLHHRIEGADHFVRFQALGITPKGFIFPVGDPRDFKCQLEPLQGPAKDTVLRVIEDGSGQRVEELLIRGEAFAHVPQGGG